MDKETTNPPYLVLINTNTCKDDYMYIITEYDLTLSCDAHCGHLNNPFI